MSDVNGLTKVRCVIKGEYYESDVTPSFNPEVHLRDVVTKELPGALVAALLKVVPQEIVSAEVERVLKERCSEIIRIKNVENTLHDLRAQKSDAYDPESDAYLGVDVSVEMLVDNRFDIHQDHLEDALMDQLGQWGSSLHDIEIEKSQVLVQKQAAASEFHDFVHFLQQQVEPHQIRRCIVEEHEKTHPPLSLDALFDCMDKCSGMSVETAAHFAFVVTELNSLVKQLEPTLSQELMPVAAEESAPEVKPGHTHNRSMKLL